MCFVRDEIKGMISHSDWIGQIFTTQTPYKSTSLSVVTLEHKSVPPLPIRRVRRVGSLRRATTPRGAPSQLLKKNNLSIYININIKINIYIYIYMLMFRFLFMYIIIKKKCILQWTQ